MFSSNFKKRKERLNEQEKRNWKYRRKLWKKGGSKIWKKEQGNSGKKEEQNSKKLQKKKPLKKEDEEGQEWKLWKKETLK